MYKKEYLLHKNERKEGEKVGKKERKKVRVIELWIERECVYMSELACEDGMYTSAEKISQPLP